MKLLPPRPDSCPACARKHPPSDPHDCMSLYYQQRFYGLRGRWPTWADAMAHCDNAVQKFWKTVLIERGLWTEPDGEPIADPPHDTLNQVVELE